MVRGKSSGVCLSVVWVMDKYEFLSGDGFVFVFIKELEFVKELEFMKGLVV